MEKSPRLNEKVIGNLESDEKENIIRGRGEKFKDGGMSADFKHQSPLYIVDREKIKSQEDLKIISLVDEATNKVLSEYGISESTIPAENIHIVKRAQQSCARGKYGPLHKQIVIEDDGEEVVLAEMLAHEMIHLKSSNVFQIEDGGSAKLSNVSVGLAADTAAGKRIFNNLNEGITEELAKKVCLNLLAEKLFATEGNNPLLDKDNYFITREREDPNYIKRAIDRLKGQKKYESIIRQFGYQKEREILNTLIDKINERRNDFSGDDKEIFQFQNRDEVSNFFTKSMLYGDLRAVIKLIDHAFYIGATQEMLHYENKIDKDGKSFNDIEGQLKFVKELGDKNVTE